MSTTPTPAGLSDERIDAIGAQFYGTCFTPADRQFAREVAAAALSSQPPSAQEWVREPLRPNLGDTFEPTMNIYAQPGTVVRFRAGGGYPFEKEAALKAGFVMNGLYTVKRCDIQSSRTEVLFDETPGRWNSCLFADVAALACQAKNAAPVYLVATGETHEGRETYTRHEGAPPPLCDSERLSAAPVEPAEADLDAARADVGTGVHRDLYNRIVRHALKRFATPTAAIQEAPKGTFDCHVCGKDTPHHHPEVWTLTAPDGRQWHGDSPIKACREEQRSRIPDAVAVERVMQMAPSDATPEAPRQLTADEHAVLRQAVLDSAEVVAPGRAIPEAPAQTEAMVRVAVAMRKDALEVCDGPECSQDVRDAIEYCYAFLLATPAQQDTNPSEVLGAAHCDKWPKCGCGLNCAARLPGDDDTGGAS